MKKLIEEFKAFALKGNVLDMAVGVIVGGAFGKIVSSIVNDLIMPLFGVILGGIDFSALAFMIGDATIKYGSFLQNVLDFLIIAVTIFAFIKLFTKLQKKKDVIEEEAPEIKSDEVKLLEEIRDLLKENHNRAAE